MDHHLLEDGGTGKKMGLARLAKSCSSSSSMNSLSGVEKMKNKNDNNDVQEDRKPEEFSMDFHHSSPGSRVVVKQSGTVTLLPSKVNVVSYSGYQSCENVNTRTSINENLCSFESVGQSLPSGDPDFQLTPKENTTSCVTLQSVEGDTGHHSHLPPQIKRSNSLTRLSEVINQIHNLCMFPAQPIPAKEKSSESNYKTSKSLTASASVKEYEPEGSLLQHCRSASLDELTSTQIVPGLPSLLPADLKRRNYLFGGLGNGSLLGGKELDRYFPNRNFTLFIATWNMNGKEPPVNLEEFLLPEAMERVPDFFVIGTQESGGSRSEWEVRLQATIGPSHVLFTSAVFGVLHLIVFMRRDLLWFCSVPEEDTYSLRPGIAYKTKGGVAIGFQFFGTRMLFINSHLTAHEEKQALRIQNFRNICHSLELPRLLPQKHKHKDVTHRYDCVFWLGDLNFRLAVDRDYVLGKLKKPGNDTYQHLLQWDQLSQARNRGEAFSEFEEGPITFAPTFKYDPGTDHYDTSSKQRVPSYTDRILFKSSRGSVKCCSYDACPLFRTSDHKPVSGMFQCQIRPGKDDVPFAAGIFNRDVYLEAIRRRKQFMRQPALRNCPVQ
ncbi:inositol polyphosphate 5-phosphatase E-like isoform X2 [Macrobrachium nipponense]|uniref:inositol polyphosphate 5-phosphatase E-like isoform X2 n=1 Tax=Macrobrachium nipponense TaxID=159736 RepID=UPI0030C83BE5